MLLLLFRLAEETYAMAGREVAEVVPMLPIRKLPMTPSFVRGAVNYRGRQVPVVDLGLLIDDTPCPPAMSTRIILVHFTLPDGGAELVGMLAQGVTETVQTPPDWQPPAATPDHKTLHVIDSSFYSPKAVISWFDHSRLLPAGPLADIFKEHFRP